MAEITLTKSNFEQEVLQSDIPVLVDFWAEWCPPCRMIAPVVAQAAEKYEGRLKVGKVNVDAEGELAAEYRAEFIPMLVLFKDGRVVKSSAGAMSLTQLEEFIAMQ